ncbi:hypothetical protein NKG05_16195 [Oerskovia sp. M15]
MGSRGETYTTSGDGQYTLDADVSFDAFNMNPDGATDLQKDLGFSPNVLVESTESRELKESYNSPQFLEYIDTVLSTRTPRDPFPPAPWTRRSSSRRRSCRRRSRTPSTPTR